MGKLKFPTTQSRASDLWANTLGVIRSMILLVSVLAGVFILVLVVIFWLVSSSLPSDVDSVALNFPEKKTTLYIKVFSGGAAHRRSYISPSAWNNREPDLQTDYDFGYGNIFCYKINGDSLFLYVSDLAPEPPKKHMGIIVVQKIINESAVDSLKMLNIGNSTRGEFVFLRK